MSDLFSELAKLHNKMKPEDFGELLKLLNKVSSSKSMQLETSNISETICVKMTPESET